MKIPSWYLVSQHIVEMNSGGQYILCHTDGQKWIIPCFNMIKAKIKYLYLYLYQCRYMSTISQHIFRSRKVHREASCTSLYLNWLDRKSCWYLLQRYCQYVHVTTLQGVGIRLNNKNNLYWKNKMKKNK